MGRKGKTRATGQPPGIRRRAAGMPRSHALSGPAFPWAGLGWTTPFSSGYRAQGTWEPTFTAYYSPNVIPHLIIFFKPGCHLSYSPSLPPTIPSHLILHPHAYIPSFIIIYYAFLNSFYHQIGSISSFLVKLVSILLFRRSPPSLASRVVHPMAGFLSARVCQGLKRL